MPPVSSVSLRSREGFTLIEVLVVISIIGILIALAFPAVSGAVRRAEETRIVSNMRELRTLAFTMDMDAARGQVIGWPGTNSWSVWMSELTNGYAPADTIQKLVSGAGVPAGSTWPPARSAVRIYAVTGGSAQDITFASTANFDAQNNSAEGPDAVPFGESVFLIISKGGDATFLRSNAVGTPPKPNQPPVISGNPSA